MSEEKKDPESVPVSATTPSTPITVDNYINGAFVPPTTNSYLPVTSPSTSATIGSVALSSTSDVHAAVSAASAAFPAWSALTIKSRAAIMLKFHGLLRDHAQELAELIVLENGKNMTEALADVAKGNETVEYACGLPQLAQGKTRKLGKKLIAITSS